MIKKYEFEYETDSSTSITWEAEDGDRLEVEVHDGLVMLNANRGGFRALAELCIRLTQGEHEEGFHVHLPRDFEPGEEQVLAIGVIK